MLRISIGMAAAAAAAFMALPAAAQGLDDNFDAEATGTTITNYIGFANFDVTEGSVDLLFDPNGYGLRCAGGSGSCIDLDGSTGNGGVLTTKSSFSFSAGDFVTLRYDVSGNQRDTTVDQLLVGIDFSTPTSFTDLTYGVGYGIVIPLPFTGPTPYLDFWTDIYGGAPFVTQTISFRTANAGSLNFSFGSNSNDNIGPILDNVSLSIAAVPEPEQWLLLILGFGLVGSEMRRRKATLRLAL